MNKYRIYVIASVSSLFIGVSVGLMVSGIEEISGWAFPMGLAAGLGGMMIELTVPEALVTVWQKSSYIYKAAMVAATIASPILLIWALPGYGIARFSVAFIVASLITYLAFYATQRIKANEIKAEAEQEQMNEFAHRQELERLRSELATQKDVAIANAETDRQRILAIEERKTKKALARLSQEKLDLSRGTIVGVIKAEPGISQRELGRRFGVSPQTVMHQIADMVEDGMITANGNGVRFIG